MRTGYEEQQETNDYRIERDLFIDDDSQNNTYSNQKRPEEQQAEINK